MNRITLVLGGARSGKSSYALSLCTDRSDKVFVATAEPLDGEMRQRIADHQAERGADFRTVEAPLDLFEAIRTNGPASGVMVLDCLTVWLGNLMHHRGADRESFPEVEAFLRCLEAPPCDLILVSNELGMGLIPESALGRRFRDAAGRVNQAVAKAADEVIFMVSGIPMKIKES